MRPFCGMKFRDAWKSYGIWHSIDCFCAPPSLNHFIAAITRWHFMAFTKIPNQYRAITWYCDWLTITLCYYNNSNNNVEWYGRERIYASVRTTYTKNTYGYLYMFVCLYDGGKIHDYFFTFFFFFLWSVNHLRSRTLRLPLNPMPLSSPTAKITFVIKPNKYKNK